MINSRWCAIGTGGGTLRFDELVSILNAEESSIHKKSGIESSSVFLTTDKTQDILNWTTEMSTWIS